MYFSSSLSYLLVFDFFHSSKQSALVPTGTRGFTGLSLTCDHCRTALNPVLQGIRVVAVPAFMNENFKKNFLSAICFCVVKENASPTRQLGNSGITMRRQKAGDSQRAPTDSDEARREAFSDGNIEVKFCDQPSSKRNLKRHLTLFSSELPAHSASAQ